MYLSERHGQACLQALDAFDGGMKFDCIKIIKDLDLGMYGKLVKGTEFECVEMLFGGPYEEPSLQFANYVPQPDERNTYYPDPKTVIRIPLREMSEHCKW